jgi:short-chain Z-isoprenyl diphosphate synthase
VARLDRLREFVDRLHPSGLLYATYEHRLIAELDTKRLPRHVAVLADGNRRWARTNAPEQPLVAGYQAGADKLKEFVGWCDEIGIPVVTLWVLSTDNLSRSQLAEIEPLLGVIEQMVSDLAATRRWQVHPVGALDLLPAQSAKRLKMASRDTADIDGMIVNIAVSTEAGMNYATPYAPCLPSTRRTAPRSTSCPIPSTSSTLLNTSTPRGSPTRI